MSPKPRPRGDTSHLAAGLTAITTLVPLAVAVAAVGGLAVLAPAQAWALLVRLAPVLLFVAAMSVVVNLAIAAGAFEAVAQWARRQRPDWLSTRATAWCQIVVLSLVSTIFLSLDTTAILVTPLAVALARRGGLSLWAAALTVIWIANIGSLLLPVSNLTNLLAVGSGVFTGPGAYVGAAWRPAIAGIGVAVAASWVAFRWSARGRGRPEDGVGGEAGAAELEPTASRRLRATLVTLAVLLPLLALRDGRRRDHARRQPALRATAHRRDDDNDDTGTPYSPATAHPVVLTGVRYRPVGGGGDRTPRGRSGRAGPGSGLETGLRGRPAGHRRAGGVVVEPHQ